MKISEFIAYGAIALFIVCIGSYLVTGLILRAKDNFHNRKRRNRNG
jgi:hypothetical protein